MSQRRAPKAGRWVFVGSGLPRMAATAFVGLAACVLAVLTGVAGVQGPSAEEIAPGVHVRLSETEAGVRRVEEVRIAPRRGRAGSPPDLGRALVAAYDWCAGNVDNGFEAKWKGADVRHGCDIRVDAGSYVIRDTAILRQRRGQRVPITIDLGGSAILHHPEAPRSVTVEELAALPCDPAHEGEYFNIVDAESFDDITNADPQGTVQIERIAPNASPSRGCPSGGTVCEYGGNATRVETHSPHGLMDGGSFGLGDVVELAVPGTPYDGLRLLVKEVVSKSAFIVTLDSETPVRADRGTLRETATTAWCNGASWRPGKPMIAIGGPGDSRKNRTTLRNARFVFDGQLYRTVGVLVDGEKAPDGTGGAEWISVEGVTHVGNSSLRGQVVVALGTPHLDRNLCNGIEVEVSSDHWPSSWSPAVWNQSCNTSRVHIRQHHGGGLWWGMGAPERSGPRMGSVHGYVEGCKDGPCLWIRSGQLVLADGFKVWGAVNGPQGAKPGPAAGLLAILGSPGRIRVNVTSHGASWGASPESDLDCYVRVVDTSRFVQLGGYLASGDSGRGTGEEWLFCPGRADADERFVLEHVEAHAWGSGGPRIVRGR